MRTRDGTAEAQSSSGTYINATYRISNGGRSVTNSERDDRKGAARGGRGTVPYGSSTAKISQRKGYSIL